MSAEAREHPKPIILVHPDEEAARTVLESSGYVVIVTPHPEHIQALDVLPVVAADMLTRVALETIRKSTANSVRDAFARRLVDELLKAQP